MILIGYIRKQWNVTYEQDKALGLILETLYLICATEMATVKILTSGIGTEKL